MSYKEYECSRGCGEMIHFDNYHLSETGKRIPLSADGNNHNCPNNPYFQKQQGQGQGRAQTQTRYQNTTPTSPQLNANESEKKIDLLQLSLIISTSHEIMKRIEEQNNTIFDSIANIESVLGILNNRFESLRQTIVAQDTAQFRTASEVIETSENDTQIQETS
jgi:hypothetical protein